MLSACAQLTIFGCKWDNRGWLTHPSVVARTRAIRGPSTPEFQPQLGAQGFSWRLLPKGSPTNSRGGSPAPKNSVEVDVATVFPTPGRHGAFRSGDYGNGPPYPIEGGALGHAIRSRTPVSSQRVRYRCWHRRIADLGFLGGLHQTGLQTAHFWGFLSE